ncbi:MAG TPA: class I SAM-dependent methyltransferase [Bacteroidia bacterium]|jgi:predicted O-methyltransferase YrrM
MNKWHFIFNYLKYKSLSSNAHGIHSPFVFNLYNNVINNTKAYYSYDVIDGLRARLLKDTRILAVTDLGAGSGSGLKKNRKVADIAAISAKSRKYSRLLFRLADCFQPEVIIEIGTSLGLSTVHLAIASSKSRVYTVEGCPETRKVALENFEETGLKNISSLVGNFDQVLPGLLSEVPSADMVFFDGNHRKEATLNYFVQCLEKAGNESVFIFDDIYWSKEMTEAWETIRVHPKVTVSIDLFQMGIIFFRKEQAKEHFILSY